MKEVLLSPVCTWRIRGLEREGNLLKVTQWIELGSNPALLIPPLLFGPGRGAVAGCAEMLLDCAWERFSCS
jgi:hypothetical protein